MTIPLKRWQLFFWAAFVLGLVLHFAYWSLFWINDGSKVVPEPRNHWFKTKLVELEKGLSLWEVGDQTIVELQGLGSRSSIASECFKALLVSNGIAPPPANTMSNWITRDELLGSWDKLRVIKNEDELRSLLATYSIKIKQCVNDGLSKQYARKLDQWQIEKRALWTVVVFLPFAALLVWFTLYRVINWAINKFS